jgi:hypothetical protein
VRPETSSLILARKRDVKANVRFDTMLKLVEDRMVL